VRRVGGRGKSVRRGASRRGKSVRVDGRGKSVRRGGPVGGARV